MRALRAPLVLVAAAAALAAPVRGQSAHAPGDADALASLARARVAELWGVDAAAVVLEMIPSGAPWPPAGALDVTLIGSGAGGHWVVRSDVPGDPGVRARAGVRAGVAVAARALPRGHVLEEADLAPGVEVVWGPPGAEDASARPGWRTLRPIAEGEALRAPAVQPPPAVRAGDEVSLVWSKGGVSVELPGTAAGAAPVGGEVAVRTRTGRRLKGVVLAPGTVDITQRGGR